MNLRGKFVLKSGLLKVDIESYIVKLLLQTYKILFVGQNVGAKQLTQGYDHLVNVFISTHLCFPGDGIKNIEQKMGIHL